MKKIIAVLMTTVLMVVGLTGCKSDEKIAQELQSEIQGFWIDDSGILFGFKEDRYVMAGLGFEVAGTFDLDGDTLTLVAKEDFGIDDKVYTVKIEDEFLYLTVPDGETTKWESITEDEVRNIISDYEKMAQ